MACLSGALLWSCSDDYDDSQIKADMADLAARIEAVQQAVTALNTDLSTYQGLINALKGKKFIKSVKEENGVVTITYNDNSTDTLTPGAKGDKGDKGDQGDPGDAGTISMPQFKMSFSSSSSSVALPPPKSSTNVSLKLALMILNCSAKIFVISRVMFSMMPTSSSFACETSSRCSARYV